MKEIHIKKYIAVETPLTGTAVYDILTLLTGEAIITVTLKL